MTQPVRIPSDVDREDTVLANLSARQLLILAITGIVLYGMWVLIRHILPLGVFLVLAMPTAAASGLLALGRRDGLSLDRLALAAVRQHLAPRYQINAAEGVLEPPAWLLARVRSQAPGQPDSLSVSPQMPTGRVDETGLVDLGADGLVALALCSTVNFALRTPAEQEALVGAFANYLHSLTSPVQILILAVRLDLSAQIEQVRAGADQLPHPALRTAAREHADFLEQLAAGADLLRRQIVLVLSEGQASGRAQGFTTSGRWARHTRSISGHRSSPGVQARQRPSEARLTRRLAEAVELLEPIGITVTPLDPGQAAAVMAGACNPDSMVPPSPRSATASDIVTSTTPHDVGEVGSM